MKERGERSAKRRLAGAAVTEVRLQVTGHETVLGLADVERPRVGGIAEP